MRDLERLQDVVEYRVSPGQLRLALLGVLAVTCGIFAVGVTVGKRLEPGQHGLAVDPLAELDRVAAAAASSEAAEADSPEAPPLTYHDELTNRRASGGAGPSATPRAEPGPTTPGRARSAPLPATDSVPARPQARVAQDDVVGDEPAVLEQPAPGESAVFTLQVASYESREEAQQFATDLRSRGHRVFLVRTSTPDRGTWYRVRVGPFQTRRDAVNAQVQFERTERLPTFLVQRRR